MASWPCGQLSMGGEGRRLCAGRWHGDRSAAGLVRCRVVSRGHAVRQDTLLRGKLRFVGRNGYAPSPSMIVEWNSKTVKRRPSKRWTSCWAPACASVATLKWHL